LTCLLSLRPRPRRSTLFPYTTLFRSQERAVVLDEHTVVEHGHPGGREHFPTGVEARRVKHDVIRLPFSGRTAHVDERRELSKDRDRKSTRLNSSHRTISYAVFCLKKK